MTDIDDQPRLRRLLNDLLEVDPPAGHLPTASRVAADYRRRTFTRRAVALVASSTVAAAVALTFSSLSHGRTEPALTPGPLPTTPTSAVRAVLTDGTTVGAAGRVVSVPGQPARLCAPEDNGGGDNAMHPEPPAPA